MIMSHEGTPQSLTNYNLDFPGHKGSNQYVPFYWQRSSQLIKQKEGNFPFQERLSIRLNLCSKGNRLKIIQERVITWKQGWSGWDWQPMIKVTPSTILRQFYLHLHINYRKYTAKIQTTLISSVNFLDIFRDSIQKRVSHQKLTNLSQQNIPLKAGAVSHPQKIAVSLKHRFQSNVSHLPGDL